MRSVRSGKAPADRAGTPVRVQFAAAFGTLVAVAALVIGFGILTVGGLEGQEQQISGRAVPYLTGLSDASVAAKAAANDERGYLLTADPTYAGEAQGRRKTEQSGLAQARAAAADAAQRDAVDKVSAALDTFNQALDAEFAMVATDQAGAVKMAVGPNRDLRKGYEKDFDAAIALAKKRVATVSATSHAQSRQARVLLLVLLGVMIVLGAGAAWLLGRAVTGPLVAGVAVLEAAAKGDLTRRAPVAGAREFRRMARSTNEMLSATADAIGTIAANADTLGATATQLAAASRDIAGSTDSAAEQAGQVSTAAAQVSESVQSVATAAEEMGATIGQIADSAAGAARVAAQAVDAAGAARDTVGSLDESSQRIGEVVRTITAIAEQTNLLALNATIEAARAGDAGKGFAVVASEVKDLAQETAQATEDIVERVAGIQADTRQAIDAIARIDTVIGQINEYQTSIASTVEEQSATTAEIGRSIILAATGSSSIADNITSVAEAVRDTTDQTGQAQEVATSLARMGHDLRSLVARFRY